VKSTPTRGVKQYLKPNAYNQSELDWTLIYSPRSLRAHKGCVMVKERDYDAI
jgi:hypothetical protein